jgi:small subunit ribosomal protein S20
MPNSKQAAKRMRQNDRRRLQNKSKRSAMKSAVKKVLAAPSADEAREQLAMAMKRVDKAAKHNVIHKNAAARLKRRLALSVNSK